MKSVVGMRILVATVAISGFVLCLGGCASPLHDAAKKGEAANVNLLLEKGANINKKNSDGRTPLICAVWSDQNDMVRLLLDKGAAPNISDNTASTPLHIAAFKGNKKCVEMLIEKGADINALDSVACTPLYTAAQQGRKSCVEVLINSGANVNCKCGQYVYSNYQGGGGQYYTYQPQASFGGNLVGALVGSLTAELVASSLAGSSIQSKMDTPLHCAAEKGHSEVVKVLIEHGADVNAKNINGYTPLLFAFGYLNRPEADKEESAKHAAIERQEQTIAILIESGANVNVTDISGYTPLRYAITGGTMYKCSDSKKMVELIVSHEVNVNVRDYMGYTPLFYALMIDKPDKEVVKLLLEHGADVNAKDSMGYTPLFRAVMHNKADKEIVKLLLDDGADVNAEVKGFWKETPLKSAKDKEIKELLRQYGAKK